MLDRASIPCTDYFKEAVHGIIDEFCQTLPLGKIDLSQHREDAGVWPEVKLVGGFRHCRDAS